MKHLLTLLLTLVVISSSAQNSKDKVQIRKIFDEALERGDSYEMLRYLTKNIGGRLSGSPQAAAAVEWSRPQWLKLILSSRRGYRPSHGTIFHQIGL